MLSCRHVKSPLENAIPPQTGIPHPPVSAPARAFRLPRCLLWCLPLCLTLPLTACIDPNSDGFGGETQTPDDTTSSPSGFSTPSPTPVPTPATYYSLTKADITFEGEHSSDYTGTNGIFAGDLNGDGFDDIALAAPGSDARQPEGGDIKLVFGEFTRQPSPAMGEFYVTLEGDGRGDAAGQGLARAGDLNGDGYDDLLIGAPNHDSGGTDAGRVYALLGRASGWYPGMKLSSADFSFEGTEGEHLGQISTLAGGDLNGDGYADIVVGSPFTAGESVNGQEAPSEAGRIYIIAGRATGWEKQSAIADAPLQWVGTTTHDWAGFSVAIVADINGDHYDDLVMGAPHDSRNGINRGAAYIWLGRATFPTGVYPLQDADWTLTGTSDGEEAGAWVESAGDPTGDGLGDLLIGAWGNTSNSTQGKVYLVPGTSTLKITNSPSQDPLADADTTIRGAYPGEALGRPAIGIGDLNQDGFDDLCIGSSRSNLASLFFGRAGGLERSLTSLEGDRVFVGVLPGDGVGFSVSGRADFDGDGYPDLLVSAITADVRGALDVGAAYLYFGAAPFEPVH